MTVNNEENISNVLSSQASPVHTYSLVNDCDGQPYTPIRSCDAHIRAESVQEFRARHPSRRDRWLR